MKIWINNYQESLDLVEKLKELGHEVQQILTASTLPVLDIDGYLIVGFGCIKRHFKI
jgi:hypothetical protein